MLFLYDTSQGESREVKRAVGMDTSNIEPYSWYLEMDEKKQLSIR